MPLRASSTRYSSSKTIKASVSTRPLCLGIPNFVGKSVFIRAIISKTDAQKLVETVPEICNKVLDAQGEEDYRAMLESHSCNELLELAVKIYSKKQAVKKAKKKLGFIDEKYLKRTEELLFGELAAALDIPPEEVPKVLFGDI